MRRDNAGKALEQRLVRRLAVFDGIELVLESSRARRSATVRSPSSAKSSAVRAKA
jgi:hypothetical protein